jgi:hypothetical protein
MNTHIFLHEGDESNRQAIVGHGSSTTHKDVHDINLVGWCIQGCGTLATCPEMTSWWFTIFLHTFSSICF